MVQRSTVVGHCYPLFINTPSWVPLQNYKNLDAPFSNVNTYFNSYGVNPYWIVANSRYNQRVDHFNGSFSGMLTPSKWFDATYRISDNFGTDQQAIYKGLL